MGATAKAAAVILHIPVFPPNNEKFFKIFLTNPVESKIRPLFSMGRQTGRGKPAAQSGDIPHINFLARAHVGKVACRGVKVALLARKLPGNLNQDFSPSGLHSTVISQSCFFIQLSYRLNFT